MITLRDYQIQGVEFLRSKKRAMLADEPGLGKTAQATYAAESPCLVICPAYLVPQWEQWLKSEGFSVSAAMGTRSQRIAALNAEAQFTVINYEMLDGYEVFREKKEAQRFVSWYRTIIIDESHHLKGHSAKRARIAVEVAKHVERVYLLTATPVKREIDDLYMQLRILHPELFTSYWRFVNTFCTTHQTHFGTQILGANKKMLPELHSILDTVMLRRDYKTAGRELPHVIPNYIYVPLSEQQRKLYNDAIDKYRIEDESGNLTFTNYMEALHAIRQYLTGYIKMDAVKSLLEDASEKAVMFSWYKNTAEAAADVVQDCALITGDIKPVDRKRLTTEHHNVSATIASVSEGVDFSDSRLALFIEEDWTPGSNYQAMSRIQRDRNNDDDAPILAYYIHCQKTIDEVIHRKSQARGTTIKEVIRETLYL